MEEIMDIIRVIPGIGQEILISLFGNMLTRLEVYVDQNGWAFVKIISKIVCIMSRF